ncbi:MAG TPA: hypothetical protein VK152_07865 [Paludibacter sp.]|nr:hypothetical protein [Paludibacter sp.]
MKKSIIKYIFLSLSLVLVLGYMIYSLWFFNGAENEMVCKELDIMMLEPPGKRMITQRDVALLLQQNNLNPVGKTLKYICTESIEGLLKKNPMVKSVECFKTPSGILTVNVRQRIPKFRVVGFGSYYVDTDRKTMPVSTNYSAYVPVVSGRITVSMATGKLFDFVTYLENNPFWNAQIEQVFIRDDLKVELVPRVGDGIIMLGNLDNYPSKLEKLRKLYVFGFNKIGWNRYKRIDLQYKDQVVCSRSEFEPVKTPLKDSIDSIIVSKL